MIAASIWVNRRYTERSGANGIGCIDSTQFCCYGYYEASIMSLLYFALPLIVKNYWRNLMPEISLFYGIRITMYYVDHNPPHFHAEYAGMKAQIDIQQGCVIRGALPNRQLKFILAWCELHRDELMQNWELSKNDEPLNKIAPL